MSYEQDPSASREAPESNESSTVKTFRLKGIPKDWNNSKVEARVKEALGLGYSDAVLVRSLSANPCRPDKKVATLEFSRPLPALSLVSDQPELCITTDSLELFLDTHFFRFTPLHKEDEGNCHME